MTHETIETIWKATIVLALIVTIGLGVTITVPIIEGLHNIVGWTKKKGRRGPKHRSTRERNKGITP